MKKNKNNYMGTFFKDNKKEIKEFLIGFFGYYGLNIIILCLMGFISYIFTLQEQDIILLIPFLLLIILSPIIPIVLIYKKKYKYVGVGGLSAFLIPLLLIGACSIIISNFG